MSRRAAVATLPLALLACAAPGHLQRLAQPAPTSGAPTPARAPFSPDEGDALFAQAVLVADLERLPVKTCDAGRARLETKPFELLFVGCGATTCLARQAVEVKLGHHVARVTVTREVYDGAVRTWRLDGEGSAAAARELLERIVSAPRLEIHRNPCSVSMLAQVAALGTAGAGGQ